MVVHKASHNGLFKILCFIIPPDARFSFPAPVRERRNGFQQRTGNTSINPKGEPMIFDHLDNADHYFTLNSGFAKGFAFLRQPGLDTLAAGRYEIDGDRVYALVFEDEGKEKEGALLEAHQRYLDVQYTVTGAECIGWKSTPACASVSKPYDAENDAVLFTDPSTIWIDVPAQHFVVLLPHDAHAPMHGEGLIRKVVLKIAME